MESSSLPPTPKRPKISGEIRQNRIIELEDRIKDLDTLMYKEKRREKASNVHNYKECDELTQQISEVKSERRLLERELEQLQKKHQRSHSYKQKKKVKQSQDSASDTNRSTTPLSPGQNQSNCSSHHSHTHSSGPVSPVSSDRQSCFPLIVTIPLLHTLQVRFFTDPPFM